MDADENTRIPAQVNLLFLVSSRIFWKGSSEVSPRKRVASTVPARSATAGFTNVPTESTVFLVFTQTEIQSSFEASNP